MITQPNTRSRRRYALAFAYLCDIAGIEHNFRKKTGNYNPTAVSPRSIPDDSLIAHIYSILSPFPQWQWAYGMMACYGLRNHEVMFCDLEDFPICYIFRGKSKQERYSYSLYPEWADEWKLREMKKPQITGKTHGDLGNRITHAFKRYGVPFAPYNLRHAWARRSIDFGYDPSLAAALMGHGLDVHTRIYQLWLTRDTYDQAYQKLLSDPNRPKPPHN